MERPLKQWKQPADEAAAGDEQSQEVDPLEGSRSQLDLIEYVHGTKEELVRAFNTTKTIPDVMQVWFSGFLMFIGLLLISNTSESLLVQRSPFCQILLKVQVPCKLGY
jgi:hypothetical protein